MFVLALLLTPTAWAQSPVLRIETGGHEARTLDAATDAGGRLLVTASEDKTARVWSLPDLRPLGVLRPQSGDGAEGAVSAVAVSPDGALAALGRRTSATADGGAVLIFDLVTQLVVRHIDGLPSVVDALAFSNDGRLAVALGSGKGIRIWDTRRWRQLSEDADYGAETYGLSFAADGRLATASFDGRIRVYDNAGTRIAASMSPQGYHPYHLAYSSDGTRLAIGFDNALSLEVREGTTLALQARPNVAGLGGTDLSCVAWTPDGRTLIAAGYATVGNSYGSIGAKYPVFAWGQNGLGPRRVLNSGFEEETFAVRPLGSGGIALVSARGALLVLDAAEHPVASRSVVGQYLSTEADLADDTRRLLLSQQGTQVAWVADGARDRWLRFDGAQTELVSLPSRPAALSDWRESAGTIRMTDWDNSLQPKLNGRVLRLASRERSHSVAAAAAQVLVGSNAGLRLLGPDGAERWNHRMTGTAWRVNQSGDGRLAVAAVADGTIRWHRLSDGEEVLALFVTADATRWIAWTPGGYYTASAGGEDLIGWQLNRGSEQAADFFAVSRFRNRYYRPDVVRRVLTTLDEAEALRQANAVSGQPSRPMASIADDLPPVITIIAPRDGDHLSNPEATIEYIIRSPSARAVRAVRLLINGNPAPSSRGLDRVPAIAGSGEQLSGKVIVPIPAGDTVDITLLAETDTRTSEPARLRLIGAVTAARPARPRPNLYAVLIGVSEYANADLRLAFAAKDAADLAALFEIHKDREYGDVQVRLLNSKSDTRESIMDAFDWLRTAATSNDTSVVFIAGHGVNDVNGRYFFLPASVDLKRLRATAVSGLEMLDILRNVAGRRIAMIDTCYSGNVLGNGFRSAVDPDRIINEFSSVENGLIVMASSTGNELSKESPEWQNGAFAYAIKEGLSGKADYDHDGLITIEELNLYAIQRVKLLTNGQQHPNKIVTQSMRDSALVEVR